MGAVFDLAAHVVGLEHVVGIQPSVAGEMGFDDRIRGADRDVRVEQVGALVQERVRVEEGLERDKVLVRGVEDFEEVEARRQMLDAAVGERAVAEDLERSEVAAPRHDFQRFLPLEDVSEVGQVEIEAERGPGHQRVVIGRF